MTRRAGHGRGDPTIREAIVADREYFADTFPSMRERVEKARSGAIYLPKPDLAHALIRARHRLWPEFRYTNWDDESRWWLLDEHDVLMEVDPETLEVVL